MSSALCSPMSSHPQSPDSAKNPRELLEEAALACVLASSGDSAALERARTALAALCDGLDGTEHHELALLALTEVANERGNPGPAAERLRRAGEHLDVLQTQLEAPQADAPELLDPRVSTLPRHPSVRLAASERAEASRTNAPVEPAASATPAVAAPAPMAAPTPTAATPPSPAAPPSPPTPPSPAVRASVPAGPAGDPELLDLFGDFLAESLEGLDKTDEILLGAEQGLESPENVNALFRVFHTIKGVSAFLGATDVTALAHATESLLDQVRQGQKRLQGSVLDRAFEASSAMRRLLDSAREAVEQGRSIPRDPTIVTLISRINSSTGATVKPPAGASHAPLPNLKGQAPSMRPSIVAAPAPRAPEPRPAVLPAEPAPDSPALEHKKSTAAKAAPPSVHAPSLQDPAAPVDRAVGTSAAEPPTAPLSIAPAKAAAEGHGKIRETVKVDLERVDSVVEMVGELIIMESMVVSSPELASLASLKLKNYLGQLTKISRDLQDVVMRMRMVPVRGVFNKMARMVRDLGRKTGKLVQLVTSGENTEMDRSMVERLEDPLVHMIRNAIDHAIESPAERRELGKTAIGTLRLSATHEGGSVAIELTDDGRGLQRDAILKKARSKGLIPESNDGLTDREVFGLIFLPGFSTAAQVSELSGRGVGMDVVKRNIESMRGRVLVNSTPGAGTSFKLILPLTLAIIEGMLVACGKERYIIPSLMIVESVQPTSEMVRTPSRDTEVINVRGELMPLLRLARLFDIPESEQDPANARVVVVESAGSKLGLMVDDVLTQQQVVIKPLSAGLGDTDFLAGAAILSDGRVGLILNVERLSSVFGARRRSTSESREFAA